MSTIIAIHQPCFLPWVGFFDKILTSDKFVILDHVQFVKDQYDNRVQIKTQKGRQWITVPDLTKHRSIQKFRDTEIDNSTNWNIKILRVIKNSYLNSKYFNIYWSNIENLFSQNWKWLIDLNIASIELLLKLIDIKIPLVLSSTLPIDNLKGHELNLKIVQHLHGNIYLSGIMGSSYLNPVEFKKENIKLIYQDLNYNSYPQLWGDFEKGLSVLDYIFNCGSEQVNQLLQEHKKLYINNNT